MSEDLPCYVYWIKTSEMTDMFTQGYIGISTNPGYRFYQHKKNAKYGKIYNKAFLKALKDGTAQQQLLVIGTTDYCKEVEAKLRVNYYQGWNVAVGGGGGCGIKHGLTGTRVKGTYYNLLTRASELGIKVCEEWLGEDGLVNFSNFYKDRVKDGEIVSLIGLSTVSPDTVIITTYKELSADRHRVHDLNGDGVMRNLTELSEITGG